MRLEAAFFARAQLLELGQELAAAGVELEHPVQRARIAPRGARARRVPRSGSARIALRSSTADSAEVGLAARVLGEELGHLAPPHRPTTMFAGMIAPEKPPLRIAKSASSRSTLRTLKFGPLVRSPPASWPSGLEP